MKICTICNLEKTIDQFPNLVRSPDGKYPQCKLCKSNIDKQYYKRKAEKVKSNANKYYKSKKDIILNKRKNNDHYKIYNKQYKQLHKEQLKEYNRTYKQQYKPIRNEKRRNRLKNDPIN